MKQLNLFCCVVVKRVFHIGILAIRKKYPIRCFDFVFFEIKYFFFKKRYFLKPPNINIQICTYLYITIRTFALESIGISHQLPHYPRIFAGFQF
jgi:hypothetical protein